MKNIKNWILSLIVVASAGGVMMTMAAPQVAYAAPAACSQGFLGFPTWYRGLINVTTCDILSPKDLNTAPAGKPENGLSNFIWHIVFNVVEIAIVAAAYLSGFYFLYGGFLFIISQGKPDNAAKARSTMIQALVGLIISLAAVTIVNFVVDGLMATSAGIPKESATVILGKALDMVYFIAGAVAVIVIILAGYTFSTAVYDQAKITQAKNSIVYAVVGLIVVIMAFGITQFVMGRF